MYEVSLFSGEGDFEVCRQSRFESYDEAAKFAADNASKCDFLILKEDGRVLKAY